MLHTHQASYIFSRVLGEVQILGDVFMGTLRWRFLAICPAHRSTSADWNGIGVTEGGVSSCSLRIFSIIVLFLLVVTIHELACDGPWS